MKKIFYSIFILIALLTMTTGAAFAGSALELVEVRNDEGVPTFVFRVTGEFSQEELQSGFVSVEGGEDFPLYCAQQDADTVVCHTSKPAAGHDIVVGFGGAQFWARVPEQGPPTQYCYPVYDWPITGQPDAWIFQGESCQESPASDGDVINFYSPYWEDYYFYDYFGEGLEWFFGDPSTNPGPGYYYASSPV